MTPEMQARRVSPRTLFLGHTLTASALPLRDGPILSKLIDCPPADRSPLHTFTANLQPLHNAGSVLSLVESLLQFELGGLSGPVARERPGSVGRPALHGIDLEHARSESVPNRDKQHSVMRKLRDGRQPDPQTWPIGLSVSRISRYKDSLKYIKVGKQIPSISICQLLRSLSRKPRMKGFLMSTHKD